MLEEIALHLLVGNIIECQRDLLILVVLVVVVVVQIGLLLGGDNPSHQLYGRIILTGITLALGLDDDLAQ